MTVGDLIEKIKQADYLDENQRKKFLDFIPYMNTDQLIQLAKIVVWSDQQKKNLATEHNLIISGLSQIFAGLNKYAAKKAKKSTFALAEKKQKSMEGKKEKDLLKKLKDA